MSNQTCHWNGTNFQILPQDAQWEDVAGVYIFAGKNRDHKWVALYVGQAKSFANRIPFHERWDDAARAGATHVHACVVPAQTNRDQLESSLIATFQPSLNTQLRSGGLR